MAEKKSKLAIGKIIFWIFIIVFLWLVFTHFAQTKQIVMVLSHGKWYWIILAVILQFFYYPFYSHFIEYIFNMFRVRMTSKEILPIYIASKFTDVALPIATVGKAAIFIRNGHRHKILPLNIGIGIGFVILFEITAFILISLATIVLLYLFGHSATFLLISLLILTGAVGLAVIFLIRRAVYELPPNHFVLWIIKIVARVAGQGKMKTEELEDVFLEIGQDLKANVRKIQPAIYRALTAHLMNLVTFAFIYLAFAGHFNFLAIIAGYVAGLLFTIVSITPQGVGVAETIMVTTLHGFGLDIPTAAVITLAYRGLLYWLPLFAGFYVFSRLELRSDSN